MPVPVVVEDSWQLQIEQPEGLQCSSALGGSTVTHAVRTQCRLNVAVVRNNSGGFRGIVGGYMGHV